VAKGHAGGADRPATLVVPYRRRPGMPWMAAPGEENGGRAQQLLLMPEMHVPASACGRMRTNRLRAALEAAGEAAAERAARRGRCRGQQLIVAR